MRRLALLLTVAVLTPACAPAPSEPSRPIAQEQLIGPAGIDVAAARDVVLSFLQAYADSGTAGVAPLRELVAGPDLRSWVRWLGVQNREFDGSIQGSIDLRSVAFVATIPIRRAVGARVDVGASVTFRFIPAGDAPFERTRILDGPMTLLRTGTADWRIVDFTRDGASMDAGITRFEGQVHRLDGVSVRLDSLFAFVPNWQFNLVVTNDTRRPIALNPAATGIVIRRPGGLQAIGGIASGSLASIGPHDTVEGQVSVPFQDSARGRALILPFADRTGRIRRFVFALGGLMAAPGGPPAGQGSASPAPG